MGEVEAIEEVVEVAALDLEQAAKIAGVDCSAKFLRLRRRGLQRSHLFRTVMTRGREYIEISNKMRGARAIYYAEWPHMNDCAGKKN